jgi:hypothetical protein
MPASLTILLANVRSNIDEASARFWSDAELTTWINDALRDVARRTEEILHLPPIPLAIVAGTGKYNLPVDVIRVHRIEFIPTGSTQTYPVTKTTHEEVDRIWGLNQSTQSAYPSYFVLWGTPGIAASPLVVQFYPVPAQSGTANIFYYRVPAKLVNGSDVAELPEGWDDVIVDYCEYRAKRKSKDPTWQEAKALYDEKLVTMIDVTRAYSDAASSFITARGPLPSWLYGGDDW